MAQDGPNVASRRAKVAPRGRQDGPKRAGPQDGPKMRQNSSESDDNDRTEQEDGHKSANDGPKMVQDGLKMGPR